MSKLHCFNDDSLSFAKACVESLNKKIRENPMSNEWMNDFFSNHKLSCSKYEFDIEFRYDFDDPSKYDFENAILIYEAFNKKQIGSALIYNEKFITSFIFQYCYKYYSSHFIYEKKPIKSTCGTLFFDGDIRRSTARNIVLRLYKMVCLSVDKSNNDPYFYTRYLLHHSGLRRMVFYTFVDYDISRLALIKAVKSFEESHNTYLSGNAIHKVLTHLSCLDNINHLPLMEENEIKDYLIDFMENTLC